MRRISNFLLIYVSPMNAPVNLCANLPLSELARQKVIEYRAVPTHSIQSSDIDWADVVVIGRLCFPEEYELCERIKAAGRYILYVLDDDLLNLPSNIRSYVTFSQESVRNSVLSFINTADGLISPSPTLIEKYGKGKKNIVVEEPASDFHEPNKPGAVINIGFAGSADRTADVEDLLANVLKKLKHRYGDRIQFYFMGVSPSFSEEIGGVETGYIDDYNAYRLKIDSLKLDIGLAPMPNSSFHSCKHYNKFIEYSSLGIVGVFSNVLPYSRLEKTNAPIILVNNTTEDWFCKISELIDNPEVLYDLKLKCSSFAKRTFNIHQVATDIKEQNHEAFTFKVGTSRSGVSLAKNTAVKMTYSRIREAVRKHGIKFPFVACKKCMAFLVDRKRGS